MEPQVTLDDDTPLVHGGQQASGRGVLWIICNGGCLLSCRFWPVRKYPWGTCEALSSEHSDFAALKKLLLETSFEELKEETERRYYRFREEELLNLTDPDTG